MNMGEEQFMHYDCLEGAFAEEYSDDQKADHAIEWLETLLEGTFRKIEGSMTHNNEDKDPKNGFCCLGVYRRIFNPGSWGPTTEVREDPAQNLCDTYACDKTTLSSAERETLGLLYHGSVLKYEGLFSIEVMNDEILPAYRGRVMSHREIAAVLIEHAHYYFIEPVAVDIQRYFILGER